ncbi:t-SNARE [Phakopsora pachyrhizi]|uniref:t-SNARE n=1 Tax=Phakopsora pachyrhizi TaxID=170000 RepID=A0AAV0B8U8_PHAPC|nr:t-SNARE [Phakopsora pachyrhizi]CAH7683409.1 t-SNARE [Phakopsora pachyrhizi]
MAKRAPARGGGGGYGYSDDQYGDSEYAPSYRTQASNNGRGNGRGLPSGPGSRPSYDEEKYGGGGRRGVESNPFEEQPIEMKSVSRANRNNGGGGGPREVSSTEEFFDAIGNLQVDLKELQHLVNQIQDYSKRSLDSKSEDERLELQSETEALTQDIRSLSAHMKQTIQSFEADHSLLRQRGDPDGNLNVRMDQLAAIKKRFVESIQRYAEVEQGARKAMQSRVERQVRIVKPDASEQEIRAAVEDEINGNGAVFQQALVSSNRMGNARNALREVQSRAADIKRIEQTITELASMFNDMATMVEEQDVQVQHIEKQAETVNQDVEAATTELKAAVVSAKGARSKRKCCFVLILVIALVLGGGITVYVLFKNGTLGSIGGPAAPAASPSPSPIASNIAAKSTSPPPRRF